MDDDDNEEQSQSTEVEDQRIRDLILAAFLEARKSGRPDWRQMSVAVLKNRLLLLTGRNFRESDYGARSITDLVKRLPDILSVNDGVVPALVTIAESEIAQVEPAVSDRARLRSDLWSAAVDYRSGVRYLWDGALAVREEDFHGDRQSALVLPTITEQEMDEWRRDFAEKHTNMLGSDPSALARLNRWRDHRLGTTALPMVLRRRWNAVLRSMASGRIEGWFSSHSLPVPVDFADQRPEREDNEVPRSSGHELRELILSCVRVMTNDELHSLLLPPAAILRARR